MKSAVAALTTIRRSPYQAIASILIMSVTFFVAYSFVFVVLGADQVLTYFETRPQIIAFFELDVTPEEVRAAQQTMEVKPYVKDVTIVDQQQALEIYREANQDKPLLLELVTADILPASIEVSADDIDDLPSIRQDLESLPSVEDVDFQETIVTQLSQWTRNVRLAGGASVIILTFISFLTIMVIIAMKATSQKKAISIMRMIGATKGFVKMPFMMEGALYGLSGALIGWIVMYALLLYLTPQIREFLGEIALLPVPFEVLGMQLGLGLVAGAMLGGFAGLLAVSRLMRQ